MVADQGMTPDPNTDLLEKIIGATSGSLLAVILIPPRSRREAARRLFASLVGGAIFASPARDVMSFAKDGDGLIAGACLAGFSIWWAGGALIRLIQTWKPPEVPKGSDAIEENPEG